MYIYKLEDLDNYRKGRNETIFLAGFILMIRDLQMKLVLKAKGFKKIIFVSLFSLKARDK